MPTVAYRKHHPFLCVMTLVQYNARIDQTNILLKENIKKFANPGVQFW